jgi:polyphosphate kinase
MPGGHPPAWDLDDPALYLNRELSWLEFNQRVLAEASDRRNLLLERVKFLAITASNLDEFFSKRVGWLKRMLATDARTRTVDGLTIAEQYDLVVNRCHRMRRDAEAVWHCELLPELADHGIRIVRFTELEQPARQALREYFERSIFPVLTPSSSTRPIRSRSSRAGRSHWP